jgi:hypothetical protein
MKLTIEPLDARNRDDCEQVADLHLQYLSDSPVVQFGQRFLRRFYYGKLVRAGLVECTIARAGKRVVGFISYTGSRDFMSRGLRRGFAYVSALMLMRVLTRPATIRDIFFTLRMMRARATESDSESIPGVGEVLSIIVADEFRQHVPEGGTSRVTARLFEEMVRYFSAARYDRVILMVKPSNRASNIFCSSMGCGFEKVVVMGEVSHRFTYRIPLQARKPELGVTAAQ